MRIEEPARLFADYARFCRDVQRRAIEFENQPERRKHLRAFNGREVADILGISQSHLRNLVRDQNFPQGVVSSNGRRSFAIEDIHAARLALYRLTGNPRYNPRRQPRVGEKLQVVTFVNFKGGSGKTTSATHFAQYLALNGYRVLLIDLDPQASATALFGLAPALEVEEQATFAGWVRGERTTARADAIACSTYWPNIDLIPATIGLQHVEYELVGRLARQRDYPFYAELLGLVGVLEDRYDVVVCDCRPDVGMLTINALIAATALVIPIPPSMMDFASSGEFFRFMSEVVEDLKLALGDKVMTYDFVRVLTTKFRPADRSQSDIVRWMSAIFKDTALQYQMLETAVIDAAGIVKETLYEYEPTSNRRSYERGLEAMNRVNAALEDELLAVWGRDMVKRREAA